MATNFRKDFVGNFLGGADSSNDPHLLPAGKLAWFQNGTVRGGFASPRPKYAPKQLTGDNGVLSAAATGLFQGAAFYAPNPTSTLKSGTLFASISGRLFAFTPDNGSGCVVTEWTPPTPNSATATQAWLGQAENYLIVQDGSTPNPMVFDGNTAFRSPSAQQVVANFQSASPAIAPAVGSSIQVTTITDLTAAIPSQYYNIPVALFGQSGNPKVGPVTFLGLMSLTVVPISNDAFGATLTSIPGATVNAGDVIYNRIATYDQSPNTTTVSTAFPLAYSNTFTISTADAFNAQNSSGFVLNSLTATVNVAEWKVPIGAPYGTPAQATGRTTTVVSAPITSSMISAGSFQVPAGSDPYGTGSRVTAVTLNYTTQSGSPTYSYSPIGTIAPFSGGNSYQLFATAPRPVILVGGITYASTSEQNATVFVGPNSSDPSLNAEMKIATFVPSGSVGYFLTNETVKVGQQLAGFQLRTLIGIPCGKAWAYSKGRLWTSLPDGFSFVAGDIVGGSSGTAANKFRDAILYTMSNTLLSNGGTFSTPGNNGEIRAMRAAPTLDASLGQGPLQVFTTQSVFSCDAPTDIATWADATNPIVTESLIGSGALSQSSTILVNGDIMFRSQDGIRSLTLSRLDFYKWANTPISQEVNRVIEQDNPALLDNSTACVFDNRILFGASPVQTPNGVTYNSTIAINLDTVSNLQTKSPPVYDGAWDGLNVLQFVTGVFGNQVRCFAFVSDGNQIGLTEIYTSAAGQDIPNSGTTTYQLETKTLFVDNEDNGQYDLLRLEDGEIYVRDIQGLVLLQVDFRHDYDPQWRPWYGWSVDNTSGNLPYKTRMGLGVPIGDLGSTSEEQNRDGYDFQFRITVTGTCNFMGMMVKVSVVPQSEFAKPLTTPAVPTPPPVITLRAMFAGSGPPTIPRPGGNAGLYYDYVGQNYYDWDSSSGSWDGIVPTGSTAIASGIQAFAGSGLPTTQTPANNAGTYYDYDSDTLYFWNPLTGVWEGTAVAGNGIIAPTLGDSYLAGNGAPVGQSPADNAGTYYDRTNGTLYNWNPINQTWE
jgi:hypothetical protein